MTLHKSETEPAEETRSETSGSIRRHLIVLAVLLLAVSGVMIVAGLAYREQAAALWSFLRNDKAVEEWLTSYGKSTAAVYLGLQALQVTVAFIPGEVTQTVGGYVFGTWLGSLYSMIGAMIGSIIAFILGRFFGVPLVRYAVGRATLDRVIERVGNTPITTAMFVLFLVPGFPKDALCYVCGILPIGYVPFLLISTVGRIPGVMISSAFGSHARDSDLPTLIVTAGVSGVLLVIGLLLKRYWDRRRRVQREAAVSAPEEQKK